MKFAEFYRQFLRDVERMGADEYQPMTNDGWKRFTTVELIKALVDGKGGVGDIGRELDRRGALDLVPGDTWG